MSRADNGRRVPVEFGSYKGLAAVAKARGGLEVGFFDAPTASKIGDVGKVGDDAGGYRVTGVTPSTVVRGLIVLSVEATG